MMHAIHFGAAVVDLYYSFQKVMYIDRSVMVINVFYNTLVRLVF